MNLPGKRSIITRIILSYIALMMIIVFSTGILYYNILLLTNISENIETIGELSNDVLEMRRFEKNYLLYNNPQVFDMNQHYIDKIESILISRNERLGLILGDSQLRDLTGSVNEYKLYMSRISSGSKKIAELAEVIRRTGFIITETTEAAFKREREKQMFYTSSVNVFLFLLIITGILFGILIGVMVTGSVVKPIKQLERGIRKISEGDFESLTFKMQDREFDSLTIAINRMITELDHRKEHLVQSQKMESMGIMASGMAHELNNPLSNISSSCQILSEEIESNNAESEQADIEFRRKLLKQIKQQCERAQIIVKTILDYGRSSPMQYNYENLSDVLNETLSLIKIADFKNIIIKLNILNNINISIDKQRFQQALINIIINSIDAMDGKKGEINISAETKENKVFLSIKDQGNGITGDSINKIFDPFYTTKAAGKGTGLGLYIAYEIIKNHGGEMKFRSSSEEGTEMTIILPYENPPARKENLIV
jgi:two-component system, NtrC family, sensor kinase